MKSLRKIIILSVLVGLIAGCGKDTEEPTVNITYPADGAIVSDTVMITAEATDNKEVTEVEFYIDGSMKYSDSNSPWEYSWNTGDLSLSSSHTIIAKAYDAADNVGTSPEVSVIIGNQVSWQTDRVSLEADHFFLIADNDTFYANVPNVNVDFDPGDSSYCSLEIEWEENGIEMRLFIYFQADGANWWSDELRTYNGQPVGSWIYYTGEFFNSELGTAFTGSVELESDIGNYAGKIHLDNLTLQAFLSQ